MAPVHLPANGSSPALKNGEGVVKGVPGNRKDVCRRTFARVYHEMRSKDFFELGNGSDVGTALQSSKLRSQKRTIIRRPKEIDQEELSAGLEERSDGVELGREQLVVDVVKTTVREDVIVRSGRVKLGARRKKLSAGIAASGELHRSPIDVETEIAQSQARNRRIEKPRAAAEIQ